MPCDIPPYDMQAYNGLTMFSVITHSYLWKQILLQRRLPATNDENEGALGPFRKLIHQQPQLTIQAYNELTIFFHNNTQLFMETNFTAEEDYKFLHKVAREAGSGEQA